MPKLSTITCSASNSTDRLSIGTDVNVTKEGLFTTTLNESDVNKIKEYGLKMNSNRLGREGYFESETLEGLKKAIQDFLNECISRTVTEEKEVIKYSIRTNCHYCQGDKEDGYGIYPNSSWLPERLQNPKDNSCSRWVDGTEGITFGDKPYSVSLYAGIFKKTVYQYASGKTVTDYQRCFPGNGRTSVDYLKSTVRISFNESSFGMGTSVFNSTLARLPEVDATEENARVFVEILQFICKANGILKQLADPQNISAYIEQKNNLKLI